MVQKNDRLVTLFGGGGFAGRYVAQALYRTGARIRIAERNPRSAYFLKPLGGVGQTQFVAADIRQPAQVAQAVRGSDAVVNLVGILKGNFLQIHVDGARNLAEAAAEAGASAFVQISAIGADPDAQSAYGRSKGQGEQAVRASAAAIWLGELAPRGKRASLFNFSVVERAAFNALRCSLLPPSPPPPLSAQQSTPVAAPTRA